MIIDKLLGLKTELDACCGKIVQITLDREGFKALGHECKLWEAGETLYGIIVDQVKECPTCGQEMKEKR